MKWDVFRSLIFFYFIFFGGEGGGFKKKVPYSGILDKEWKMHETYNSYTYSYYMLPKHTHRELKKKKKENTATHPTLSSEMKNRLPFYIASSKKWYAN